MEVTTCCTYVCVCVCTVCPFRGVKEPSVSPGLTAATIVFGFARNLSLFHVLVKSAQSLHNRMFKSILATPVRFFDINPIGKFKHYSQRNTQYWYHFGHID